MMMILPISKVDASVKRIPFVVSHHIRITNVQAFGHVKVFAQILPLEVLHTVFKDGVRYTHVSTLYEHVAQTHADWYVCMTSSCSVNCVVPGAT